MAFNVQDPTLPRPRDNNLYQSIALSNGAGSVTSSAIDMVSNRPTCCDSELLIVAPKLNSTQLPDTYTMTYIVEFSASSSFGTITRSITVGVQTGASSAGAAADEYRCGVASDADRYVRLKVTKTGTGDCTGVAGTIGLCC